MNIVKGNRDHLQTVIIPVMAERLNKQYIVRVSEALWNEFQVSVLLWLAERNLLGEFDAKDDDA